MKQASGYALLVTGFLACPCHLVITLPLLAAVLGSTAVRAFVAGNVGLITVAFTVYFVAGLSLGWLLLQRSRQQASACDSCELDSPQRADRAIEPSLALEEPK